MAGGPEFGLKIDVFKSVFFDREKVLKAVDRTVARHLNWFGGYVRRTARNSLKPSDSYSAPGEPPHTHVTYLRKHTGRDRTKLAVPKRRSLFRDTILYGYEREAQTVVVGPFLFNGAKTSPTVPELLEYGGETTVIRYRKREVHRAKYAPRPYMRPAFEKAISKFFERLKDSVK